MLLLFLHCGILTVPDVELDQEVKKWKGIVDSKNNEIQRFRTELDAILDILKLLQKQGVVIPVSSAVL
jgi:protein QN1